MLLLGVAYITIIALKCSENKLHLNSCNKTMITVVIKGDNKQHYSADIMEEFPILPQLIEEVFRHIQDKVHKYYFIYDHDIITPNDTTDRLGLENLCVITMSTTKPAKY